MTRGIVMLDDDPFVSIEMMYDVDVIGLPITIGQILLTAWYKVKPGTFADFLKLKAGEDVWLDWVMESQANYVDLWNYAMDIVDEHFHRFGSHAAKPYRHGMKGLLDRLQSVPPLPDVPLTPYPPTNKAAYRQIGAFFEHTRREVPAWLR